MKFLFNKTKPKNNFSGSRLFLPKEFTFNSNTKKKLCNYLVSIICYKNSHERVQRAFPFFKTKINARVDKTCFGQ